MSDHVSSARSDAPRRVDLAIARIDAWTVMKVSFLLSVALGLSLIHIYRHVTHHSRVFVAITQFVK